MDGAALLELGDLAVGDPGDLLQFPLRQPGAGSDLTAQPGREALPELPGVVVEEDGSGVVVGGRVEGGTELGRAVQVVLATPARTAGGAVVDRAEGRCGEGGEDAGVLADGGGDVPAVVPGEPGPDQVVGVPGVRPGAGRAAGGAAVAAGDPEPGAGFVLGGVPVQDLPEVLSLATLQPVMWIGSEQPPVRRIWSSQRA